MGIRSEVSKIRVEQSVGTEAGLGEENQTTNKRKEKKTINYVNGD